MATLTFSLMVGCGDHDGSVTDESTYAQKQNETYNALNRVFVGHWVGSEQLKDGVWTERSSIYAEYTFNVDGTFYYKEGSSEREGTYLLYKNQEYVKNPSYEPQVILDLEMTIPRSYSAYLDVDGRLRLDRISTLGTVSISDIRYVKQ